MQKIDAFNDTLQSGNHWITAAGIREPQDATVIDNRNGLGSITQGSLFNAPEHYSGFWLINADSEEQALRLALEGSEACNRKVELRPYIQ
jgi:hypothetical protein